LVLAEWLKLRCEKQKKLKADEEATDLSLIEVSGGPIPSAPLSTSHSQALLHSETTRIRNETAGSYIIAFLVSLFSFSHQSSLFFCYSSSFIGTNGQLCSIHCKLFHY